MRRRVNPGSLGGYAENWFETRGLNVTQKLSKKQNEDLQICFDIFDADGSGKYPGRTSRVAWSVCRVLRSTTDGVTPTRGNVQS